MALILSVETSTDVCSVALHQKGVLIGTQRYDLSKSHASLLAAIIQELLNNADYVISDLNAIAVSAGPGSYTGLRIGVSTVKGIAYASDIPIVGLDSLDIMYDSVVGFLDAEDIAISMMDARRMEVYCQVRDAKANYLTDSHPHIVEETSFSEYASNRLIVFGNGAQKTLELLSKLNVKFLPGIVPDARHMGKLAYEKFLEESFEDTAYFEPKYLKEYRTIPPKQKL